MNNPRRFLPILAVLTALLLVAFIYNSGVQRSWEKIAPSMGLGDYTWPLPNNQEEEPWDRDHTPMPDFKKGTPVPGYNYSRILVIPKMHDEDTDWIQEKLPNMQTAIYVADDPTAPLHPPKNKGHEVMIYLTYIIDHYDELPDIMIFMHAHQYSWHNADLLNYDAAQMISRLSNERVTREGFMNMRCQWGPGCPDWMHPGETEPNQFKQEEILLAKAWAEIFPLDPVPKVLAQPCCSQFAVSRDRILSIPKRQFIYYRDWLLRTRLKDFLSGRVWEYMWQFALTGKAKVCPIEHVCYCDGFGLCFGDNDKYQEWFKVREHRDEWNHKLDSWKERGEKIEKLTEEGKLDEANEIEKPKEGEDEIFKVEIKKYQKAMDGMVREAAKRGKDPRNRALEAGRPWKEGDGF